MFNIRLHHGATRNILLIGRWAIKVPSLYSWTAFLEGLLANLSEREFNTLKSPVAARVKYCDPLGLLLVMERADRVLQYNTHRTEVFFQVCELEGLPVDPLPHNIGVFGKRLKLIDYGSWTRGA